jgi:hypothetical protein
VAAQSPNPAFAPWLDLRAYKIADPIDRLRFLRREMGLLASEDKPNPSRRGRNSFLLWIAAALLILMSSRRPAATPIVTASTLPPARTSAIATSVASQKVWMIERSGTLESYSNGLRIDSSLAVSNHPRGRYPVFSRDGGSRPSRYGTQPAGIVYHTTESHLAPFEEKETGRLKQLGRYLLDVLREQRSYHYLIDRFGRVFRVVEESDAANHVGTSVWADGSGIYVNLNSSFLGVAFEGQTGAAEEVTPAQILAARLLTEMLRSRYSIAAEDCVTHAQVSVNPQNMLIGAHVDWAAQFPFASLGLPDNYAVPLPSLYAFGFESDTTFARVTGGGWEGLRLAETQVTQRAAAEGIAPARYRVMLQRRYKDVLAVLQEQNQITSDHEGGN